MLWLEGHQHWTVTSCKMWQVKLTLLWAEVLHRFSYTLFRRLYRVQEIAMIFPWVQGSCQDCWLVLTCFCQVRKREPGIMAADIELGLAGKSWSPCHWPLCVKPCASWATLDIECCRISEPSRLVTSTINIYIYIIIKYIWHIQLRNSHLSATRNYDISNF